jgi:hypothetical protein
MNKFVAELNFKQNERHFQRLLKASIVAYSKAKSKEYFLVWVVIVLAFAYPWMYYYRHEQVIILFIISFSFNIVGIFLSIVYKAETKEGAFFKEQFDREIFGFETPSLGHYLEDKIANYELNYKGAGTQNWYSTNLPETFSKNKVIAICQLTNTNWDVAARKRFQLVCIAGLSIFSVYLIVFFIFWKPSWDIMFLTCYSCLSLYTYIANIMKGNLICIESRKAVSVELSKLVYNKGNDPDIQQLKEIQKDIYITRTEQIKVPDTIYRFFKKATEKEHMLLMERINSYYK